MVRQGQVTIIDEFTGRAMDGRRYSDGLHQAIEAKEKVAIQPENQTHKHNYLKKMILNHLYS